MILYKKYQDRRAVRKGQEPDDIPCCPTRIPIIGPLLFSLLIFSPFILSNSDVDPDQKIASSTSIDEQVLNRDQSSPILEISDKTPLTSFYE